MASKKDFLTDLKKYSYDMDMFKFTKARFEKLNNVCPNQTKEYWREFFSYDEIGKGKLVNIKNWLRYRILGSLNFGNDCDCDRRVFQMYNAILDVSNPTNGVFENLNQKRIFTLENIDLETDTMNSFATLFNEYLRTKLKYEKGNWVEEYENAFNIPEGNKFYRDMYFLLNIEKWYDEWSDNDKAVLDEFEKFAQYTHCLANMMLVPIDYNVRRQSITDDFWDLTLQDLQNKYLNKNSLDKGFTFVAEHILDKFLLHDWFKSTEGSFSEFVVDPLYKDHSFKSKKPKGSDRYLECIKEINRRIEARASRLSEKHSHLNFKF